MRQRGGAQMENTGSEGGMGGNAHKIYIIYFCERNQAEKERRRRFACWLPAAATIADSVFQLTPRPFVSNRPGIGIFPFPSSPLWGRVLLGRLDVSKCFPSRRTFQLEDCFCYFCCYFCLVNGDTSYLSLTHLI